MGTIAKQIGWSQEAYLLHAISRELERLAGIIAASGGGGGSSAPVSGTTSGIVNNIALQELGGVDKLIHGVRAGTGNSNPDSTVFGKNALGAMTTGIENNAFGFEALRNVTSGSGNDAFGWGALQKLTTGTGNSAYGDGSLGSLTTGTYNVSMGVASMNTGLTASENVAIGGGTLQVTTSNRNVAVGINAFLRNTIGGGIAIGYGSLVNATTGYNLAIGLRAGDNISTGTRNIIIGQKTTGTGITTGNDNLIIGQNTDGGITGLTTGSGNTIIGRVTGLAAALANTVIISDGVGTQRFVSDSTNVSTLPAQTIALITANATGKAIITKEYLASYTPSGGITGTAAAGQVSFWSGVSTQAGNANFVWDNVNSRLGIGVPVPTTKLDVAGDILINGIKIGRGIGNVATNIVIGTNNSTTMSVGVNNVIIGELAGSSITTGGYNVLIGGRAGRLLTVSGEHVAIGGGALDKLTVGTANTALGAWTLYGLDNGLDNTAVGYLALNKITTGNRNTAIGRNAGTFIGLSQNPLLTSSDSVFLGSETRPSADNCVNETVIGYLLAGHGSNTVTIGNTSVTDNYFNGNIHATGTITGAIIAREGGLSTEFLMADGSSITSASFTGINLNSATLGDLPISRLNGGSGASASTFWRGDGTWAGLGFNIISGSAVLDFPNTAGNSSSDLTFAVPGVALGDVVSLGVPNAAALIGTCYTAWVSAANTVSVRFNNYSAGAKNPASSTFKIKIIQ